MSRIRKRSRARPRRTVVEGTTIGTEPFERRVEKRLERWEENVAPSRALQRWKIAQWLTAATIGFTLIVVLDASRLAWSRPPASAAATSLLQSFQPYLLPLLGGIAGFAFAHGDEGSAGDP